MLSITAPIFKLFLLLLLQKTSCCLHPALHFQNNQINVFKYSGNYHRESRNPKLKPWIRGGVFYVENMQHLHGARIVLLKIMTAILVISEVLKNSSQIYQTVMVGEKTVRGRKDQCVKNISQP